MYIPAVFVFFVVGLALSEPARCEQNVQILEVRMNEVILSSDPTSHWAVNDSVCVFNKNRKAFCGVVLNATKTNVQVRVDRREEEVPRGTYVSVRPVKRTVASETTEALIDRANESKTHDVAIGLAAGLNYFYPLLQLQQALGKEFAIGLMPLFASFSDSGSSVTAFGGFLTGSYYYTHFPFRGFYMQAGAGAYAINSTIGGNSQQSTKPAIMGLAAWRGRASWELGLDIGVGLGLQYIFPTANSQTSGFQGLLPLFQVTLAMPF